MAEVSFRWTGNSKQGGYGSTSTAAKSASKNNTLTITFTIDDYFKSIVNTIQINSVLLYITCGGCGNSAKKTFSFTAGISGSYTSVGTAYNNRTYLNLGTGDVVKSYLSKGGALSSKDPSSSTINLNSSSGCYTANYCNVTEAQLVVNYTILTSTFTVPDSITLGSAFDFTIDGVSSYTHDLSITINNNQANLISGVKTGTNTCTPDISLAKYITTSTSASAILTLTTKNTSGDILGSKTSSITVNVPANSNTMPTCSQNGDLTSTGYPYAYKNSSTITIKVTGATKQEATIVKYSLTGGGISQSTFTNLTTCSFSFVPITSGKTNYTITITDSRGLTGTKDFSVYVTDYFAPSLITENQFPLTRNSSNHYVFKYNKVSVCTPLLRFITGNEETNTATVNITINNSTYTNIGTTWTSPNEYGSEESYPATVTVTETGGQKKTTTLTYPAPSGAYLLHFLYKKNSVGIGCAAEALANGETGKITMGWPVYARNNLTIDGTLKVGTLNLTTPLALKQGGTGVSVESYEGLRAQIGAAASSHTHTKLAIARTISVSGRVAGSANFDGSADISITTSSSGDLRKAYQDYNNSVSTTCPNNTDQSRDLYTVVEAGTYAIQATVGWAANATNVRAVWITSDSSQIAYSRLQSSQKANFVQSIVGFTYATAGTVFKLNYWQNSGSSLAVEIGFQVVKL